MHSVVAPLPNFIISKSHHFQTSSFPNLITFQISLLPNFIISKSHHFQTSSFPNLITSKLHHFQISLLSKSHYFQTSSFPNLITSKLHHFQISLLSKSHHFQTSSFPNLITSKLHHFQISYFQTSQLIILSLPNQTCIVAGDDTEGSENGDEDGSRELALWLCALKIIATIGNDDEKKVDSNEACKCIYLKYLPIHH